MTINRLVHLLSKTLFPIRLYIIEHNAACPVTVTMQGFVNDQTLPKQLTTLYGSLPSKMDRQIKLSRKTFYNKTIVVPVFKDSKFPVGSVTLKITVKIKNKNPAVGHNDSYHSSGQLDSFLDPLQSASVGVVKQRAAEYLPNVWLPPPLTFTCSKVQDNIPAVTIDETPTVINKTDQSSKHAADIASLFPVDDGHWSAIMQCNDSSFPWKGAVLTKCSHAIVDYDKKISNDLESPIERLSENEKINFKEYPYLSGLYKELMLLHDNTALAETTNPSQTVRDIRSQSVQTDPLLFEIGQDQHNHSPSLEHTAMCPHHDDDLDSEELINVGRQHNNHIKTTSLQLSQHNTTTMRNNSSNSLNSSEMSFEQTGTFSNDRHVDSQQPIKEVDCNLLQTTDKDNSNNLEQQMSPNSFSSSDSETSQPFIPILTISQASSMCIPQIHNHAAKLNQLASAALPPLPSSTNMLHPSEQHPSTSLQVFQSTESALGTLTGAVSNEVKCGNQCLEQKIYLASSMQSIDRDTLSLQHNNEADSDSSNSSVTHYNKKVTYGAATIDNRHGNDSSSSNTISDSSTYVTSLITDDHVIEELEIESDYDNYSEDFESDDDN